MDSILYWFVRATEWPEQQIYFLVVLEASESKVRVFTALLCLKLLSLVCRWVSPSSFFSQSSLSLCMCIRVCVCVCVCVCMSTR